MNGIEMIAAERKRQVEVEGWTPEHDDQHRHGELADAGACYALMAGAQERTGLRVCPDGRPRHEWPFGTSWWKPSEDPLRNLAKAGALIAAEIDRLRRTLNEIADQIEAEATQPEQPSPGAHAEWTKHCVICKQPFSADNPCWNDDGVWPIGETWEAAEHRNGRCQKCSESGSPGAQPTEADQQKARELTAESDMLLKERNDALNALSQERHTYRCFHCKQVFDNDTAAAEHFGCSAPDKPAPQPTEQDQERAREITEQITHMVNRFLQWKLPRDFQPDCGIHFDANAAKKLNPNNHTYEPVGTNLLSADQAREMVRFMIDGFPDDAALQRERRETAQRVCNNVRKHFYPRADHRYFGTQIAEWLDEAGKAEGV